MSDTNRSQPLHCTDWQKSIQAYVLAGIAIGRVQAVVLEVAKQGILASRAREAFAEPALVAVPETASTTGLDAAALCHREQGEKRSSVEAQRRQR